MILKRQGDITIEEVKSHDSSTSYKKYISVEGDFKNFIEMTEKKWIEGSKEYGEDTWKELTTEQIYDELESEIIDIYNYCKMLIDKGEKLSGLQYCAMGLYEMVQRRKNKDE